MGLTTVGNVPMADASPSELRRDRRATRGALQRAAERHRARIAERHRPLERFTVGQRIEVTAPLGTMRPFAGRTGTVLLLNPSGSAWVRIELPQNRLSDHILTPAECSAEVGNG